MNLILNIPDAIATRIAAAGGDPERTALEALVAEEYRAGRMTKPELCAILGFEVLDEFDGFLKTHDVYEPYAAADLAEERRVTRSLGL